MCQRRTLERVRLAHHRAQLAPCHAGEEVLQRAAQQIRFLTHPLWRAYISTYVEGFDLLSRWLAARPADQPVADRFVRLLDEPLTPHAVAIELRAA